MAGIARTVGRNGDNAVFHLISDFFENGNHFLLGNVNSKEAVYPFRAEIHGDGGFVRIIYVDIAAHDLARAEHFHKLAGSVHRVHTHS